MAGCNFKSVTTKQRTDTDAARITTAFALVAINDAEHRFCAPRIGGRTSSWLSSFLFPVSFPIHHLSSPLFHPFPLNAPLFLLEPKKSGNFSLFFRPFFFFFSSSLEIRTNIFVGEGNETRIYASSLEFGDEWTSLRKSDRELYFFFFFFSLLLER